jgi:flagellin-specific chaperone FliS
MDGLSAAASVTAIIDISAKVVSLCFQYSAAVKDAKKDIERLGRTVTDVKNVIEDVKQLLDREDKTRLSTTHKLSDSLKEYSQQLQKMQTQLKPGKTHKVMSRIGMRALTWPFTSKQVEKSVASLEEYQRTFSLALRSNVRHELLVSCTNGDNQPV